MNRSVAPTGHARAFAGGHRDRAVQASRRGPAESPTRWSFILKGSIILVVLVFVGRAHEVVPGVPPLPIGNLVVLAAAVALALGGYLKRLPLLYRTPQLRLAFLLLLVALATIPFALWPGGATSTWISAAKLWTICLIIPLATTTTRELSVVTRTFAVASALLVAGYVFENLLGISNFTERQSLGFDRNDVSLFAAMGIPYALAWAAPRSRGRFFGFGLAGFLVVGIIATGSRGGFLAMAAVGAVFLMRSRLLNWPNKVLILAAALALSLFVGSGDYWQRIGVVFSDPTEDYNFQAREGRVEIWKRGIGYAKEHPVTGVGIGNFPVAEGYTLENLGYGVKWSTAHNAYILALVELGVPGLLVFVLLIGSIYREADAVSKLGSRGRGPPLLHQGDALLPSLGDATKLSLLGYCVAAVFLSVTYYVAFLFLVSVAAVLHLLRRRAVARHAVSARGPMLGSRRQGTRRG